MFWKARRYPATTPVAPSRCTSPRPAGTRRLGHTLGTAPLCPTARSSGVLYSSVVHELPLGMSVHAGSLAVTTRHGPRTDGVADTSDPIPPGVGDCGPRSGCQWGQVLGRPRGSQTAPLRRVLTWPWVERKKLSGHPKKMPPRCGGPAMRTSSTPSHLPRPHLPAAPLGATLARVDSGGLSPPQLASVVSPTSGSWDFWVRFPCCSRTGRDRRTWSRVCCGETRQVKVCAQGFLGGWGVTRHLVREATMLQCWAGLSPEGLHACPCTVSWASQQ